MAFDTGASSYDELAKAVGPLVCPKRSTSHGVFVGMLLAFAVTGKPKLTLHTFQEMKQPTGCREEKGLLSNEDMKNLKYLRF